MKNEDINFVRRNPQTAKYHSTELGDTLRGSSTAIPLLAAQKLCGIHAEFPQFLVTSTVQSVEIGTVLTQHFTSALHWWYSYCIVD